MEYQAGNQKLIDGKDQTREIKSVKKSLWWKVLVCSAFAILAVVMLVMVIDIRTNQTADFKVKLQDALVEQFKIAQHIIEEQLENITKEFEQMYKAVSSHDCKDLFDNGMTQDGQYTIFADNKPINVWCDMSARGAVVLMRRYDGSLNFSRTFQQYSDGFGDLAAEHWLGLSNVHRITGSGNWTLRIDLESFDNDTAYSEYTGFRVDCGTSFTLQFNRSSFKGTAGDNLDYFHGMKFSALDKDQDEWENGSCSRNYGKYGGWWFNVCQHGLFTGMPYGGTNSIYWKAWKGREVLKAVTMKISRN